MKIRKWLFSILSILTLLLGKYITVYAEETDTVYSDGYYYYHLRDGFVSICGYFGSETVVDIPSSIITLPVSRIESGTFDDCDTVTQIILPDTIMEVQDGAFNGAENLTSVKDYQGNEVLGNTSNTTTDNNNTNSTSTNNNSSTNSTVASTTTNKIDASSSSTKVSSSNSTKSINSSDTSEVEYVESEDETVSEEENKKNLEAINSALNSKTSSSTSDESSTSNETDEETDKSVTSSESVSSTSEKNDEHSYTWVFILVGAVAVTSGVIVYLKKKR